MMAAKLKLLSLHAESWMQLLMQLWILNIFQWWWGNVAVAHTLIRSRAFNTTVAGCYTPLYPTVAILTYAPWLELTIMSTPTQGTMTPVMYTSSVSRAVRARSSVDRQRPQPTRCPRPREVSGPCPLMTTAQIQQGYKMGTPPKTPFE